MVRYTSVLRSVKGFNLKGAKKSYVEGSELAGLSKSRNNIQKLTFPVFESLHEERNYKKARLAAAFRIFAKNGFDEGVAGHISVRDPLDETKFWLNPLAQHFSTIKSSDLILVDHSGEIIEGGKQINRAAFEIHGAIHKYHPHVNAICHAHSKFGRAFSAFGEEIKMYNQDACRFYNSHGVYKDFGGVVFNEEEGHKISAVLGTSNKILILQNHGILSVGDTVDEAAFWYMSFEKACETQLQIEASSHDGFQPKVISDEAAQYTVQNIGTAYKGWLNFQGYYDEILKLTKGDFLK